METIITPTHQQIIAKAQKLQVNTQIRVTGQPASYTLYNVAGLLFIGQQVEESENEFLPPYYPGRTAYTMRNRDGKATAINLQRLKA